MNKNIFILFATLFAILAILNMIMCFNSKTVNEPEYKATNYFYNELDVDVTDLIRVIKKYENSETLGLTQVCLDDYNKIMHTCVAMENIDPTDAGAIFKDYTGYWIKKFDLEDTGENRYRIWKWGPRGYTKDFTSYDWRYLKAALETQ